MIRTNTRVLVLFQCTHWRNSTHTHTHKTRWNTFEVDRRCFCWGINDWAIRSRFRFAINQFSANLENGLHHHRHNCIMARTLYGNSANYLVHTVHKTLRHQISNHSFRSYFESVWQVAMDNSCKLQSTAHEIAKFNFGYGPDKKLGQMKFQARPIHCTHFSMNIDGMEFQTINYYENFIALFVLYHFEFFTHDSNILL